MRKTWTVKFLQGMLVCSLAACGESDQSGSGQLIQVVELSGQNPGEAAGADESESPDLESSSYKKHKDSGGKDDECQGKNCDEPGQNDEGTDEPIHCSKSPSQSDDCQYPLAFISCEAEIQSGKKLMKIEKTSPEFRERNSSDVPRVLTNTLGQLKQMCLDHPAILSRDKEMCVDISFETFTWHGDNAIGIPSIGTFQCVLAIE